MARRQGSNQYQAKWGPDTPQIIDQNLMSQVKVDSKPGFVAPLIPDKPGAKLFALTAERSKLNKRLQSWFDSLGPQLLEEGPRSATDGTKLYAVQGQPRPRWNHDQIWDLLAHQASDMSAAQALDAVRNLCQSGSWSATGLRELGIDPKLVANVEYGERLARPTDTTQDDQQMSQWDQQLQYNWEQDDDLQRRLDMVAAGLRQQDIVREELRQIATEIAERVPLGDKPVEIDGILVVAHRDSNWSGWNHDACWEYLEQVAMQQAMDGSQAITTARKAVGTRKWRTKTWCGQYRDTEPGRWSIKVSPHEPTT